MGFEHLRSETKFTSALERELKIFEWFYTYLVLSFNMQLQTQSNWCWAATATSVSKFYSSLSPWTQCKVAAGELPPNQCCNTPVPTACNVPWYLDRALKRTNNFVSYQGGTITWERVKEELEKGLVVGARQGWSGGGGHFMVIHGVSRVGKTKYLHIDDPIYGKNTMTYNTFATNYQGSGTWTHTYFTEKYFYFMWFKDLVLIPELLGPILEVRPLRNIYEEAANVKETEREGDYNIPHHTYHVGLNEIKRDFKLPETPRTLRVIEMQDEEPAALYEVGLNAGEPELIQMNVSQPYFRQLDESLGRLKERAQQNKELGEVRLIKVPALNIEAFWLHYDGDKDGEDIITPVKRFENDSSIDWDKTYTEREFTKLLQELARKIDTKDDELGA
jgi:hypothetical protein